MEKNILYLVITVSLFISGCTKIPKDIVYQTSTVDALLSGVLDGDLAISDLTKHGNFGIGTFDKLDGEMLLLDGEIYQVRADGKVYRPKLSNKTPFATVCNFISEQTFSVPAGTDYPALEKLIDRHAPNRNVFYAIKLTGKFKNITTRSVPAQKRPYPSLKEITKHQPKFYMENVIGTLVGFRCPPYVKGINIPGYHLHFISDDYSQGGHVLSFELLEGNGELDLLSQYFLRLPVNSEGFNQIDLSKDRTGELEEVEK